MIGGPRFPSGSSVNFPRPTTTESKTSESGWKQTSQGAQETLSQHPALRAFQGESGFEGVGGPGAARMDGARRPDPREMMGQLGQAIQELLATLETLQGQQTGEADASSGAAGDVSGTDDASATESAEGTEAAQDAASADETEDSIRQILDTLKQLLGLIDQFQQRQSPTANSDTANPVAANGDTEGAVAPE